MAVGEIEARMKRAEGDLAVAVGADRQRGRPAEVEVASLPEVRRDDPPAADQPAIHRGAHGEAPAKSFGSRTRL
jgi:hypothetical protein